MSPDRAKAFLQMIRRSRRGRLKVYLGYGPGVGKTYQMLLEGHRLKEEGIDVVVGLVETHGRAGTAKLVEGLEVLPRKRLDYRGMTLEELDAEALLWRRPQVALVDELAHTNVPGSKNEKRYQDVQEVLAEGIHVITTLNLQHLESLYDTVERLIGVKVRERLPDSVLADADQVVNVDLSPEDLQKRLAEGKVYPRERIPSALENFFRESNLEQLRELTLRELASQIDSRRREAAHDGDPNAPDQVMVCLSSRGPNSARLLRYASRIAGRLNRNWYAVYVQTPSEEPTAIDAATQRLLSDTLTLANELGATVFTFKGHDVADTILRFAREYRIGHIIIGQSKSLPWWMRWIGKRSVGEDLIRRARGVTVIVVDVKGEEQEEEVAPAAAAPEASPPAAEAAPPPRLSALLSPARVVVWREPVSKERALRDLLTAISAESPAIDVEEALRRIEERERKGSTFFNEGVALPHARFEGLPAPEVALGIAREGILDAGTERPIEAVFLLLAPGEGEGVRMLAEAARALQSPEVRRRLRESPSTREAAALLAAPPA